MMKTILYGLALIATALPAICRAGNPLIPHVYAADPSAHVWPGDDRLWLYTSHDEPGANTHDSMASYHVFSTRDGVNWVDYGMVMHVRDVKWAISHAWAIDAVLHRGVYHLVYCAKQKGDGMFRTGLATSKLPQGPFKDIGFIQGVEWGQDPALFVDDDGQAYLFWGAGHTCHAARLTDDLRAAVPGTVTNLTAQLTNVFEGPWLHKHKGKYYLSYPGLPDGKWPERMYYAVADRPLGPYTSKGEYMGGFKKQSGTNHGSIIRYKDRWIFFYHSAWVSDGMSECRNLMADFLNYRDDGTIAPMEPTDQGIALGVPPGPSQCVILLEAENGEPAGGTLIECQVGSKRPGSSGAVYVEGFESSGDAVTVMAQVAKPCQARLSVRYLAPEREEEHKVMIHNATLLIDPVRGETNWEKLIAFPKAETWTEKDLGIIPLKEGDNYIKFIAGKGGLIAIDSFRVEPILTTSARTNAP